MYKQTYREQSYRKRLNVNKCCRRLGFNNGGAISGLLDDLRKDTVSDAVTTYVSSRPINFKLPNFSVLQISHLNAADSHLFLSGTLYIQMCSCNTVNCLNK